MVNNFYEAIKKSNLIIAMLRVSPFFYPTIVGKN